MENKLKLRIGLAFSNAIIMSVVFSGIVIAGLVSLFGNFFWDNNFVYLAFTPILIFILLLTLIPVFTYKFLQFDKQNDEVYSYYSFYGIKKGLKVPLSEYDSISLGSGKKVYSVNGNTFPSSRSQYNVKTFDINLYNKTSKKHVKIAIVRKKKRAIEMVKQIANYTHFYSS